MDGELVPASLLSLDCSDRSAPSVADARNKTLDDCIAQCELQLGQGMLTREQFDALRKRHVSEYTKAEQTREPQFVQGMLTQEQLDALQRRNDSKHPNTRPIKGHVAPAELDDGDTHNTQEPLTPGTEKRLKIKASRQRKLKARNGKDKLSEFGVVVTSTSSTLSPVHLRDADIGLDLPILDRTERTQKKRTEKNSNRDEKKAHSQKKTEQVLANNIVRV